MARASPIPASVNSSPLVPRTLAPDWIQRAASGMSPVTTMSPGPAWSAIQSSAASKSPGTTWSVTRSLWGVLIQLLATTQTSTE